ncbi:hypothetical protein ASPZODRAFT_986463 [Penicilliopsis zonata CBS 506.65]|uniref:HTH La-type RNA-binding domain-containing protein n=1 Tax=Penicilliopsis zonata CBS 506.65 TaxID=1073090 RepID=A0A1L9SR92_9EURO|nr:hypothetical protein ASPZODRAFT_986463 [Penicilliopsis zonata CBS 506.65]OJJ49626.1 hypothetical protein ASPZODRAFT_986463 [Penicilliopsis zonata CBS 506.65]
MAATTSKSEMPVFSYAQAAKGLSTPPQSGKPASADIATPPASDEQKTAASTEPQSSLDTQTPEAEQQPASDDAQKPEPSSADLENETTMTSGQPQPAVSASKSVVSGTSSPSVATVSTLPKDDDSTSTPNGGSDSTWDKQSQASVSEKVESTKAKSATAASEKPAPPPKELRAAPIPTVNIWQQRKEAQEAKAKAIAALKPVAAPTTTKAASTKNAPGAPTANGESQNHDSPKTVSKKKGTDNTTEAAKDRKKADGAKAREDDSNASPVGDAASWPTPHLARGEEEKRKAEKTDKSDRTEKTSTVKSGKEKWMPVPYVPSAVFNTPLPTASRRGGRPARGGREGGARGGAHGAAASATSAATGTASTAPGAGDNKAVSGQTTPNYPPKQANAADRGRNEPSTARANSLPAQTRRSNSADTAAVSDARRGAHAGDRNRTKGPEDSSNAATGGRQVNGEAFPRHGKAFAKNQDQNSQKGGDNATKNPSGESHSGARAGGAQSKSTDGYREANGDSHKDKENFRESRADRGGRGSHRGRGGHAAFNNAQNAQFSNGHASHHPFAPQKSFGFGDRQRSQQQQQQHGLSINSQQSHRLPLRSPSLPNSASMYGAYPFTADMNAMYGYQQPMHPGPMGPVPYQHYMEPYSLMNMLSMQMEYYFSVDNLCKDLFLRRHMDSQGFVLLSFIASFKRVKSLTEDFELLRHVCRQLRTVEYLAGEDGADRLRPRERWEQWVLPVDQRDPSAQNQGPPPSTGNPDDKADVPNGIAHDGPLPNGTSGLRASGTTLSSAAPEFSPSTSVTASNENVNRVD